MSETSEVNLYAAPEANVDVPENLLEKQPEYHITSGLKVIIFSILSMGIYSLVWFYQQWRRQKIYGGEDCWPVARAVFSIFFAYALFTGIKQLAEIKQVTVKWSAGLLATIYIVSSIASNLSDKILEDIEIGPFASMLVLVIILFIPAIVMQTAQKSINDIYRGSVEDMNEKFSLVNWVFTVLLLAFWGLMIFGLLQS